MRNVLGKLIVAFIGAVVLSQNANASSDGHGSGFYIVPKAVVVLGETIGHHGHEIDGDSGVGIGVDLGYSFTKNYAVEAAVTHAEADVKEDGHEAGDAEYTTYGVNAVYTRNIVGHLGFLLKLGYVWEYEKMDELHIKETLSGIAYAGGLEYGVADNMELVLEYEGAEIKSSRGDSILFGLKYKF